MLKLLFLFFCGGILGVAGETLCPPNETLVHGKCRPLVADVYCDNVKCGENMKCDEWNQCICLEGYMEYLDEDDGMKIKCANLQESVVDYTTENFFIGENFGSVESVKKFISTPDFGEVTESSKIGQKEKLEEPRENVKEKNFENEKFPKNSENQISNTGLKSEEYSSTRSPEKMLSEKPTLKSIENVLPSEVEVGEYFEQNSPQNPEKDLEIQDPDNNNNKSEVNLKNLEIENFSKYSQESKEYLPEHIENGAQSRDSLRNENAYSSENDISTEEEAYEFEHNSPQDPVEALETQDHEKNKNEVDFENQEIENFSKGSQENSNDPEPTLKEYIPEDIENGAQSQDSLRNENGYSSYIRNSPQNPGENLKIQTREENKSEVEIENFSKGLQEKSKDPQPILKENSVEHVENGAQSRDSLRNENGYGNENDISTEEEADKFERNFPQDPVEDLEKQGLEENKSEVDFNSRETENFSKGPKENSNDPQPTPKGYIPENMENGAQSQDSLRNENGYGNENDTSSEEVKEDFERNSPQNPEEDSEIQDSEENKSEVDFENRETENFSKGPQENSNDSQPTLKEYTLEPIENGAHSGGSLAKENGYANENVISSEEETNDFQRNSPQNPEKDSEIHGSEENKSEVDFENQEIENFSKGPQKNSKEPQPPEYTPEHMENGAQSENSLQNSEEDSEIQTREENKSEVDFENRETENFFKGPQENSNDPQSNLKENITEHIENGAHLGDSMTNRSGISEPESNRDQESHIEKMQVSPEQNQENPKKFGEYEHPTTTSQKEDKDIENPIDLETEVVSDDDERKISDAKPKENQELKMVNPADEKLPSPENNEKDISKQELDLGANNFLAEEFVTLPSWEEFEENLKLKENIEYRFQFHDPSSVTNKTLNEENERPLAPPEVEVKHKKANENHEPAILFSAIQNEPGSEGFFRESENSQNEKSLEPTNGDDSKIPTTTTTMEIKNLHLINSEEPLERDAQKISSEGGHDIIVPYNANLQVISEISELEQLSVGTESLKSLASETKNWTSTTQRSTSGEDLDSKKVYEADQNRHDEKRSDTIASEGGTEYRNSTTEVNPSGVSQANVTTEGEFNGESEENQSRHEEERPQSMSLGRGQIKIKEDSSTTTASERENEVRPNTTEKNLRSLAESSVPSEGELHEIFDENQSGIEKESRSSAASQDEREETSREQGQIPNEEESSERASEYRASTTERNVRGLAEANVPSEGEPNESLNENQSGIENENRSSTSSQGEREDTSIERGQIPKKEESLTIIALEREGEYRSSTTENNRRGLAESRMPSEGELHELFDENQGVIDKERRSFTASPSEREDTSRELETTDERTDSSENLDEVEVLSANQNRFVGSQMKMPEASKDRENEEDNSEEKQNHGEKENSFPTESEIEREYWLSTTEAVSNKFSVGNNVGSEENFNSDSNLPERDTRGEVESSKGSSEKNDDVRVLAEEQSAFVGSTMNISKDSREKESLEAEPSQQEGERLHSIASEFEREQAEIISNKSPNENITSEEKFVNSDFILPESVATKKSGTSTDFSENSKERTQDYKNYSEEKQSQEKEEKTSTTESEIGREYWHDTTEGLLNRFSIGKNVGLEEKLNSDSKLPEIKSLGEFETNNQKFSTDNQSQQESPTSTTSDSQREKLPRTIDNILEEEFSSKEKINSDSNHPEINTLEDMKKTEAITNSNFSDSSENFHDIEVLSENQNGFVGSHLKMLNVSKAEEIGGESEPQNKSQEIDLNGNIAIDQHPSSSANSSDVDEKKVKGKISQMDEEALMAPKMDKENGIGEKIQDLHNSRTSNPLAGETPENSGEETVIDKHMDVGEQNERPLAEINPNKNNNNEGYPDQDSKPGHDTYQIRGDIPTEFENDPSPEATREWEREKQLPERNFKKIQNKENNSQMQRELENKDSSTTSSLQGQTEPEHKETSTSNLQHQTEPEHKATSSPDSKGRQFVDQFSTTSTISHETQTEPEPKETLSLNGKEREFKSEDLATTSRLEDQRDPKIPDKNENLDHTQTLELQHQKAPAITHNSVKSEDPTNSGQEEGKTNTKTSTLDGVDNYPETSTKTDSEKVISTSQEKVLYPSIGKDESLAFIENILSQISVRNASQGLQDQDSISEKILMRENILQNNVTTISPHYLEKVLQQEDPIHQEESSKKADSEEINFSSTQEGVVDPSIDKDESLEFIKNIPSQISAQNASQGLEDQNAINEKILMGENILQNNVATISTHYPEKAHRQEDPVHQEESSTKASSEEIKSSLSQEEVVAIGKDKSPAFIENIPSKISAQNASQDLKDQNAISEKILMRENILQDNGTTISPQYPEKVFRQKGPAHEKESSKKADGEDIISSSQEEVVKPSIGKDDSLEFIENIQSQISVQNTSQDLKDQNATSEKILMRENIRQTTVTTISPHYLDQPEDPVHQEESSKKADGEDIISSFQEEVVDPSIGKDESLASKDGKDQNTISDKNMQFKEGNHDIMFGSKVEYIPLDNVTTISPQNPEKNLRLENTDHLESGIENGISMKEHKDPFISPSFNDNVQKPTISSQYPVNNPEKNLRLDNTVQQEDEIENEISMEDKHKDPQFPEDVLQKYPEKDLRLENTEHQEDEIENEISMVDRKDPQHPEKHFRLENTDHQERETINGLVKDDHKDPFISPSINVGVQQPTISPLYPEKELRLDNTNHQESETENGISLEDKHKDPQNPENVLPQYPEKELRLENTAYQENDSENGISMEDKHMNPQYNEDVLPQYPQKELRLDNTAHQEIETENGISIEDHKDTIISKIPNSSRFTTVSHDSNKNSTVGEILILKNNSATEGRPNIGGGGNLEITPQKSLPPTTADPLKPEINSQNANPAGRLVPTTANPHLQNSTKSQGIVTNVKVTTLSPDSHTSRPIDPETENNSTTGSACLKSRGTQRKEDDYRIELSMENVVVVKTSSEDTSNDPGDSVGRQILTYNSEKPTLSSGDVGTEIGSTKGYDNHRNHADLAENPIPIEKVKSPLNNGRSGEEKYYQVEDDDETEITTLTSGSSVTAVHAQNSGLDILEVIQIKSQTSEPIITGILGIYIPEANLTNSQTEKPREILPSESLISEGNILVIHDPYNRPQPLPTTASPILNATKEMPKSKQEKSSTKRKSNKEIAQNSNDYPKLDTEDQNTVAVVPNVPSRNHKVISNTTPKTMQQSLNTEQISPDQYKEKPGLAFIDPSSNTLRPKATNTKSDLDDHKMESSTETMPNGLNASHPSIKGMSSEEVHPADVAKILDETLAVIDDKSQTPSTESVLMTTKNVPFAEIASNSEEEKKEEFSENVISAEKDSLNLHTSNKTSLELNPKYLAQNVNENQTADDAPKNMLHISNKNPDMPVDKSHIASTKSTLLENKESFQVNGTSGNVEPHEIEFKTFNKSITEMAPKSMPHIVNGHPISETQTPSTESRALEEFAAAGENLITNSSLIQDPEAQVPKDHGSVKTDNHGSSTIQNETLENEIQASNVNFNESIKTKAGNQNSDSTTEIANTLPRVPLSQNGDSQLRGNEMMSNSIIGNGDEKEIKFEAGRDSSTTESPKDSDLSSNSSSSEHFEPESKSFSNISQHEEENAKSKDAEDSSFEIGVTFPTTLKPEVALEKTLKVEPHSRTLNANNADDFSSETITSVSTTEAEELLVEKNPPELISKVSSHGERFTSATMEPEEILRLKNGLDSKLSKASATTPEDSHSKENLTSTTNESGTTSPTTAEASVPLEIPTYLNAENPPKDNAHGDDYASSGSTRQNLDSQATEFTSPGIEEIILINAENPLKNNSHGDGYSLIGSTGQNLDLDNQISELTTPSIGPEIKESNLIISENPLKNNSLGDESTGQNLDNQDLTTPSIGREIKENNSDNESNRGDSNATTIWRENTKYTEDTSGENSSLNTIEEQQKVTATEIDLTPSLETHFATDRETYKNSDNSFPDLFSTTTTNDFQSEDIAGRASTEDSKVQEVEPKTLEEMAGHFSMDIDFDEIPSTTTSHENKQEEIIAFNSRRESTQQFEPSSEVAENSKNSKPENTFEEATTLSTNISKGLENNLTLEEFGISTPKIFEELPMNPTSDQTLKEVGTPKISEKLPNNSISDQGLEDILIPSTTPHTNEDIFEIFNNKNRSDEKIEKSLESNSSEEAGSSSSTSEPHNFDGYDTTATSMFEKIFKQLNFSEADTKEIESNSSKSNSSEEAVSSSSTSEPHNLDGYDITATSIFEELYKTFKKQPHNFSDTDTEEIENSSESNSPEEAASSSSSSDKHKFDGYDTTATSIFEELYKTFKQQHNLSDSEKRKTPPQTTTERTENFSRNVNFENQTTTAPPLSEGTLGGHRGTAKEDKKSWTNAGNTEVLNVNKTSLSGGENSDKETISSNTNKYNTEQDETMVRNNHNKILIGKTHKEREKILRESGAYETTTTEYNTENNNNTTSTTKQSNQSKLTTVLRPNTTTLPPIHAKEEAHHIPKNRRKPIITYAPPPNEKEHENSTQPNELSDYCSKPENICSPRCCGENTFCNSPQGCQCREGFREIVAENTTMKHCVAVTAEPHKIPSSYIFIGLICLILALIYMSVKYFNVTQVGRHNV